MTSDVDDGHVVEGTREEQAIGEEELEELDYGQQDDAFLEEYYEEDAANTAGVPAGEEGMSAADERERTAFPGGHAEDAKNSGYSPSVGDRPVRDATSSPRQDDRKQRPVDEQGTGGRDRDGYAGRAGRGTDREHNAGQAGNPYSSDRHGPANRYPEADVVRRQDSRGYAPPSTSHYPRPAREERDERLLPRDNRPPPRSLERWPLREDRGPPREPPRGDRLPRDDLVGPPRDERGLPRDNRELPRAGRGPPRDDWGPARDDRGPPRDSRDLPRDDRPRGNSREAWCADDRSRPRVEPGRVGPSQSDRERERKPDWERPQDRPGGAGRPDPYPREQPPPPPGAAGFGSGAGNRPPTPPPRPGTAPGEPNAKRDGEQSRAARAPYGPPSMRREEPAPLQLQRIQQRQQQRQQQQGQGPPPHSRSEERLEDLRIQRQRRDAAPEADRVQDRERSFLTDCNREREYSRERGQAPAREEVEVRGRDRFDNDRLPFPAAAEAPTRQQERQRDGGWGADASRPRSGRYSPPPPPPAGPSRRSPPRAAGPRDAAAGDQYRNAPVRPGSSHSDRGNWATEYVRPAGGRIGEREGSAGPSRPYEQPGAAGPGADGRHSRQDHRGDYVYALRDQPRRGDSPVRADGATRRAGSPRRVEALRRDTSPRRADSPRARRPGSDWDLGAAADAARERYQDAGRCTERGSADLGAERGRYREGDRVLSQEVHCEGRGGDSWDRNGGGSFERRSAPRGSPPPGHDRAYARGGAPQAELPEKRGGAEGLLERAANPNGAARGTSADAAQPMRPSANDGIVTGGSVAEGATAGVAAPVAPRSRAPLFVGASRRQGGGGRPNEPQRRPPAGQQLPQQRSPPQGQPQEQPSPPRGQEQQGRSPSPQLPPPQERRQGQDMCSGGSPAQQSPEAASGRTTGSSGSHRDSEAGRRADSVAPAVSDEDGGIEGDGGTVGADATTGAASSVSEERKEHTTRSPGTNAAEAAAAGPDYGAVATESLPVAGSSNPDVGEGMALDAGHQAEMSRGDGAVAGRKRPASPDQDVAPRRPPAGRRSRWERPASPQPSPDADPSPKDADAERQHAAAAADTGAKAALVAAAAPQGDGEAVAAVQQSPEAEQLPDRVAGEGPGANGDEHGPADMHDNDGSPAPGREERQSENGSQRNQEADWEQEEKREPVGGDSALGPGDDDGAGRELQEPSERHGSSGRREEEEEAEEKQRRQPLRPQEPQQPGQDDLAEPAGSAGAPADGVTQRRESARDLGSADPPSPARKRSVSDGHDASGSRESGDAASIDRRSSGSQSPPPPPPGDRAPRAPYNVGGRPRPLAPPAPPPDDERRVGSGYGDRRPVASQGGSAGGRQEEFDSRRRPPLPAEALRGDRRDPYDDRRSLPTPQQDDHADRRPPPRDEVDRRQPPPPQSWRHGDTTDRRQPPPPPRRQDDYSDRRQPPPPPARYEQRDGSPGHRAPPPPPLRRDEGQDGRGPPPPPARRDEYDDRRPPPPVPRDERRDDYGDRRPPPPQRRDEYDDRRQQTPREASDRRRDDANQGQRPGPPPPPRRDNFGDRRPPDGPAGRGGRDEYPDSRPPPGRRVDGPASYDDDRRRPPPPPLKGLYQDRRGDDEARDRDVGRGGGGDYGGRGGARHDGPPPGRGAWERDRERERFPEDARGRPQEHGYRNGAPPGRRGSPPPNAKRQRLSPPRADDARHRQAPGYQGPHRPPAPQPPQPGMNSADIVRAMMSAPHGGGGGGPAGPDAGGHGYGPGPAAGPAATGGASTAALTAEQKRKLLWGAKKVEAAVTQGAESLFGANRWDRAAEVLETDRDKEKFQRLMGLKGDLAHPPQHPQPRPPSPGAEAHLAMTREQQERVLTDVEQQYMAGLRRKENRTGGLGM